MRLAVSVGQTHSVKPVKLVSMAKKYLMSLILALVVAGNVIIQIITQSIQVLQKALNILALRATTI